MQDNGESGSKVLANGNFAGNTDEHPEGTDINVTVDEEGNRTISETDMVNVGTKELMAENEAILLKVGETHQLKFYLWLENDDKVDQLYLTDGQFEGKLSIEAVDTHDNGSAEVAP